MHADGSLTADVSNKNIVDVPFVAPLTRLFAILCGLGIAVLMIAVIILSIALSLGTVSGAVVGAVTALAVLLAVSRVARSMAKGRVNRLMLSMPRMGWRIADYVTCVAKETRAWHPMVAMREMVRVLAANGHTGIAVRIGPRKALPSVSPLTIPFEPQMLDETETSFRQLCVLDGQTGDLEVDGEDDIAVRRVKRNVALKGGWVIGVFLGCAAAFELIVVAYRKAPTYRTVLYPALFLMYLFLPVASPGERKTQLLAVPGGLIARKAKRHGWQVRLFARASSTLCVYRAGRRQWTVVVADAEQAEMAQCTQTEAMFAMRAWLSPLDPPSPDRLSDLS